MKFALSLVLVALLCIAGCKTKSEVRREQEMARLRKELRAIRGGRADTSTVVEETRGEIGRLANVIEERAQYQTMQFETLKKELESLNERVGSLEQQIVLQQKQPARAETPPSSGSKASYRNARDLYKAGKYREAAAMFQEVIRNSKPGTTNQSQFLQAECLFLAKDYTQAAVAFGRFKRSYPRDPAVAKATYRQAQAFRSLGKTSEAKLFYREVIDRHARSAFAKRARAELKTLR